MVEAKEYGWEIADAAPEAITLLDQDGRILAGNAAWRNLIAPLCATLNQPEPLYPVETERGGARGLLYLDLCAAAGGENALPPLEGVERPLQLVLAEGGRAACDYAVSGAVWSVTFVRGKATGNVTAVHRKLREKTGLERARENEALYFSILNKTRDGVFVCDSQERLLFANASLCRWMGKECANVLGRPISRLAVFEMDRILLDENAEVLNKGVSISFEISAFSTQGICTFNVLKVPYRVDGVIVGVVGIVQDITEERAMEREMIEISDREKQRLGQELHENLCQYLVGISLLANVLYEDLVKLGLKQGDDARQINGLVKDAISEVRALAKGLAPLPQEHGEELMDALQEMVTNASVIGKVQCRLAVFPEANDVPVDIALHLFRIAQEAVHNAVKHASASVIELSLQRGPAGALVLKVEDDGEGMHSRSLIGREEMGSGLGIHMMKYRSRAIGAELEFHSRLPKGTSVICTVPGSEALNF